jgi:hypothetical protein
MELSDRQEKRPYRRYREEVAAGLKHRSAGRPSNRTKRADVRARVLALVAEKYGGEIDTRFGPTLDAEHLASEDGLVVDHETLRRWMVAAGLWSRARKRSPHRRRRDRRAHFGELVKLDGSFHPWFEARGAASCLLTMVDDATGGSAGRFGAQETIWAAVGVLRDWIGCYGIPPALYMDWKNVYVRRPNQEERETGAAPLTRFGRMCAQLGIQIIPASSPQAKGRVQRHHGTHQDRLVKKLRRCGIGDLDAANAFLASEYWPDQPLRAPAQRRRGLPPRPAAWAPAGPGVSARGQTKRLERLGGAVRQPTAAGGAAESAPADATHGSPPGAGRPPWAIAGPPVPPSGRGEPLRLSTAGKGPPGVGAGAAVTRGAPVEAAGAVDAQSTRPLAPWKLRNSFHSSHRLLHQGDTTIELTTGTLLTSFDIRPLSN